MLPLRRLARTQYQQTARLDVPLATIENLLQAFSTQGTVLPVGNEHYTVALSTDREQSLNRMDLSSIYIPLSNGTSVPLSSVVQLSTPVGPAVIHHTQLLPSVSISWNLKPDTNAAAIQNTIDQIAGKTISPPITSQFVNHLGAR